MRDNGPITDREIILDGHDLLVSRTDTAGRITFVNDAFVRVSGFSEEELLGAPHNLVRHPHMPKQAFTDLWNTVKDGRPWEGLVKNRTKTGDYYWVRANVTPITEGGATTGFISIRSKPTRAQVAEAESAYARLRGGDSALTVREGRLASTGLAARLATARKSLSGTLMGGLSLLAVLMGISIAATHEGFEDAAESMHALVQTPANSPEAQTIFTSALEHFSYHDYLSVALMVATIVISGALGWILSRRIQAPLDNMSGHFDAIARAEYRHVIADEPAREFHSITARLRALQAMLAYNALEKQENDRQAEARRRADMERIAGQLNERIQGIVDLLSVSSGSQLLSHIHN